MKKLFKWIKWFFSNKKETYNSTEAKKANVLEVKSDGKGTFTVTIEREEEGKLMTIETKEIIKIP